MKYLFLFLPFFCFADVNIEERFKDLFPESLKIDIIRSFDKPIYSDNEFNEKISSDSLFYSFFNQRKRLNGLGGLGVLLKGNEVTKVFKSSKTDLSIGDKIEKIDGKDFVLELLRGAPESKISLMINRKGVMIEKIYIRTLLNISLNDLIHQNVFDGAFISKNFFEEIKAFNGDIVLDLRHFNTGDTNIILDMVSFFTGECEGLTTLSYDRVCEKDRFKHKMKVLVSEITNNDGAFLAYKLHKHGYEVIGNIGLIGDIRKEFSVGEYVYSYPVGWFLDGNEPLTWVYSFHKR